ncbi:MAG TPA: hypothetical protein VIO64_18265 [Pseudobacteroides sp.]|uniref:hypothetical protein n=1 Tax=Pseudobacteroides sp. TaxID=1968840 RepID=UPI002F92614C
MGIEIANTTAKMISLFVKLVLKGILCLKINKSAKRNGKSRNRKISFISNKLKILPSTEFRNLNAKMTGTVMAVV